VHPFTKAGKRARIDREINAFPDAAHRASARSASIWYAGQRSRAIS